MLVAEAAAALVADIQTRNSVVKGIQRWRSIMAELRAEHGRFVEEGSAYGGPFLPPAWYVAMHEDLLVVDAILRDRFCVDFCLSGPVDDPDTRLKRVDCKEAAPDGRFDTRLACEYAVRSMSCHLRASSSPDLSPVIIATVQMASNRAPLADESRALASSALRVIISR